MSWENVKIGDICNVGDGAHASIKRTLNGIPYYSSKNFKIEGIDLSKVDYIAEEDFKKHFKNNSNAITKPLKNDILLSIIGSIGAPYIVNDDEDFGLSSSVSIIRPNILKIEPSFLYYWIKSDDFQNAVHQIKSGVAQSFLSLSMIKQLPVSYPNSLPTQKRIASILSAYDDLIENNLKRIKLLEETAQNIYKEWFVHFRFPNYEQTAFDEVSGLPVGWEMKKLSELCILIMGQSPKSEFYNENREGLPFHQGVTGYGHRFVTHSTYCTNITRIAEEGDILFSVRAPVGRLNIAPERLIIGRGLSAIRNNRNCQSFQLYQLKNHFFQEDMIGGGAIFNSVTKNDLENQLLILPTENIVDSFEKVVKPIDEQIWKLNIQNQKLKEARDILLPRLMNRTIEV